MKQQLRLKSISTGLCINTNIFRVTPPNIQQATTKRWDHRKVKTAFLSYCVKVFAVSLLLVCCVQQVDAQEFAWAKNMGGTGIDRGEEVAVDGNGNVYVTGYIGLQGADFNSGGSDGALTSAGGNDVFVAKYSSSGTFLWAKSMGGAGHDGGYSVAVDGNGNVYVSGTFSSTIADFNPGGTGGTITSAGNFDIFVAKYSSSGTFLWAKGMGGTGIDNGRRVAVDGNGNVYVTGYFDAVGANLNPGGSGGSLTSAGNTDIFVAKYDPNGAFLWAKGMGGTGIDQSWGVAVDGNGNVYITGNFGNMGTGGADFNPGGTGGALTNAGGADGFVAKYDPNGNYLWAKGMGGTGSDYGHGVAVDGYGNVYVTGYFNAAGADFNPGGSGGALTSAGSNDVFVAKYSSRGAYLWAKSMGGTGIDYNYGAAVDGNGNVYATGYFNSATANFNPGGSGGILTNTSTQYDVFIVKFTCNDTTSSYLAVAECRESYLLNEETYTINGIYEQHFSNTAGCDSTVILDLTFYQIEPAITVNDEFVLGVAGAYATYQWIKDGTDIPGAASSTYTVTENGDYQVRVTNENDCEGTSVVYPVTNVSVKDVNHIGQQVFVYPNPVQDIINISSLIPINIHLYSIEGRSLLHIGNTKNIPVKNLAKGIYLLRITDKEGKLVKVEKILKQ